MATTFADALGEYGSRAYLLTVAPDGPHTSHVDVSLRDDDLVCWLSRSAVRNILDNPNVSLLWPPLESGGYSVIVNGIAEVREIEGETEGQIQVSKSVLHRPGRRKDDGPGPCTADCQVLDRPHSRAKA